MNGTQLIKSLMVLLFSCTNAYSQNKAGTVDSLEAYRAIAQIGSWYTQVPLLMKLQLTTRIAPAAAGQDSLVAEVTLFYGKSEFYMRVDGLEQIGNDSLLLLVNREAKIINLYPGNKEQQAWLARAASMFSVDSSLRSLVESYTASVTSLTGDNRQVVLQSRKMVTGTNLPRELIKISFAGKTHQPIAFDQTKTSLVPIDAETYNSLHTEPKYAGKLVSISESGTNLFFILKQQQVFCRFVEIDRKMTRSPVKQEDRIRKAANGEYQPVGEMEGYLLSKSF